MIHMVQSSPWAREFLSEQEQTRLFISDITGAGKEEIDAMLEIIKWSVVKKSMESGKPLLELYHRCTQTVRDLLEKGIPLAYLRVEFERIGWM